MFAWYTGWRFVYNSKKCCLIFFNLTCSLVAGETTIDFRLVNLRIWYYNIFIQRKINTIPLRSPPQVTKYIGRLMSHDQWSAKYFDTKIHDLYNHCPFSARTGRMITMNIIIYCIGYRLTIKRLLKYHDVPIVNPIKLLRSTKMFEIILMFILFEQTS